MANTIRIKRRLSGDGGAPSSLENAELAYNEVSDILFYGKGTGGAGGTATAIMAIGGPGAFVDRSTNQTINGVKTFSQTIQGNAATATKWATPRSVSITGDGTVNFTIDGSANVSATFTLPTVLATPGTYTRVTVDAKGRVTAAGQATLDQLGAPTANISLGGYRITNSGDPIDSTDLATRAYVDRVAQGLKAKNSVKAATARASITLSGEQTIDGVAVKAGDRVLVKDQAQAYQNGIYIVSTGAWTRAPDADTWEKLISAFLFVEQGAENADTGWVCTIDAGGTLGTTAITFTPIPGAGSYSAGTGLTLTDGVFSIANTGVAAGAYGAATKTLMLTINAQGQITAASAVDITIDGGTF